MTTAATEAEPKQKKHDSLMVRMHKEFALEEVPNNEETKLALVKQFKIDEPATTSTGYELHRVAIGKLTKIRTAIEARRKELKAEYLEKGRAIDGFAKDCTTFIESIEVPLRIAKKAVDDEAENKKKAQEEADRLAMEAREKAERDAEEARLKKIRDEENERNRLEAERLAAERKKLDDERKAIDEANRIEREKLAKERADAEAKQKKIEDEQRKIFAEQKAEKERLERLEFERLAKIKAEQKANENIIRDAYEAEERRLAKEKSDKEAEAARKLMLSDVEKVQEYAKAFIAFPTWPTKLKSKAASVACKKAHDAVLAAGKELESFGK